jgi:hypothetical protein
VPLMKEIKLSCSLYLLPLRRIKAQEDTATNYVNNTNTVTEWGKLAVLLFYPFLCYACKIDL